MKRRGFLKLLAAVPLSGIMTFNVPVSAPIKKVVWRRYCKLASENKILNIATMELNDQMFRTEDELIRNMILYHMGVYGLREHEKKTGEYNLRGQA